MKKHLLFLFSFIFLLSCAPDTNGSNEASMTGTNGSAAKKSAVPHFEASVLAPLIGYWEFRMVVGVKDKDIRAAYNERWIDLKGDQSFTTGKGAEATNSGRWGFDPNTSLITFEFEKEESIATEFAVQGVGKGGVGQDVIIFKGNTPNNPRGIQVKVVKENKPQ